MTKKQIITEIQGLINEIGITKLSSCLLDSTLEFKYNHNLINTSRNLVFHINVDYIYKITVNQDNSKLDIIPVIQELKNLKGEC